MYERKLIIFDMDGVLVDVGMSYREVVRASVFLYLREVLGLDLQDDGFITRRDVSEIKKQGGLNNDWDLTGCIINLVLRDMIDPHVGLDEGDRRTLQNVQDDSDAIVLVRELVGKTDRSLLERVPSRLGGKSLRRLFEDLTGTGEIRSPLLLDRGEVGTGNLVKRIFQEVYLGSDLFIRTYGDEPLVYTGGGYIEREKLIPSTEQLETLAARYGLSIATGRPRQEAEHALERFQLTRFFPVMVSEDEVAHEEARREKRLRKPHPYSVLLAMERSEFAFEEAGESAAPDKRCMYVGDMPDDMVVARRAGVLPVGYVNDRAGESAQEREEHTLLLQRSGAALVVGNFGELIEFALTQWC